MAAVAGEVSGYGTAAGGVYVRNLVGLFKLDAMLAVGVERVHPGEMPTLERAKEGGWTARVGGKPEVRSQKSEGGGGVYLCSRYRPVGEGEGWAKGVKCEDRYVVVVMGFGLGYHVRALLDRMPADAMVVVAEPELGVLKAGLSVVDVSEELGNGRLMIFSELDRGRLVERLEPRSVLFTAGAGTLFAAHGASVQMNPGFHAAFQKLITEFVAFTRTGFITLMLNNVATYRNVANNLGRYVTTRGIDGMKGAYAGVPAVLVAAGPSLAKNVHLLKEVARERSEVRSQKSEGGGRRAVVICVQTMLKPLLAGGIEPDFVTSLDYNTVSTRFFENLEESAGGRVPGVHLVAEAKANWNVLDVYGGTMSLLRNEFAERVLGKTGGFGERDGLKAGATVAHLSFYLAEYLGCDPIILVGQDLGFVDGLYYKPGTAIHETWGVELGRFNTLETKEWERIVRSRPILRKIPDVHGHPMYTEEQFFVYLQQFERDFAASRHRVIDATEGGAKKEGVEVMRLREAIDLYCSGEDRSQEPEVRRTWKEGVPDGVGRLEGALLAVRGRLLAAEGMVGVCEETLPVLKEMLEKQGDAGRMGELFVAVDRLRTKVAADPETFEMVVHLNTIGELRRFHADLMVKKKGDVGKEESAEKAMLRQKRQLMRDVEYVENLKVGAERLKEVMGEAAGRLERQIAAMRAGRRWPVEVAGG